MMNFPSLTGKNFFTMAVCLLIFILSLLRAVGRRELIDGNISHIVNLETFECRWPDQSVLS
jgi:hypothetical protein